MNHRSAPPRYRFDNSIIEAETAQIRGELDALGWTPTDGDDFTLLFDFRRPDEATFRALRPGQRVNHFPGMSAVDRKDDLHRHLTFAARRARRQGRGDRYRFVPESYLLPGDRHRLLAAAGRELDARWLLKPRAWGFSEGIDLVGDPTDIDPDDDRIVQRYLDRPLLLDRHPHKHVLRLYALITSLHPLVVYVHRRGLVRFAVRPYTGDPDHLDDQLVHVTYPPQQQRNPGRFGPQPALDLATYRSWLRDAGHDDDLIWSRLRDVVARTVIAARDPMLALSRTWCDRVEACFELLGFDILLDAQGHPLLCEANCSPSIGLDGPPGTDERASAAGAKPPMVHDMLQLLGISADGVAPTDGPDRFEAEFDRAGEFELLVPGPGGDRYASDFVLPSAADGEQLARAQGRRSFGNAASAGIPPGRDTSPNAAPTR